MTTPTEHPMRYTPVGDYHYEGKSPAGWTVKLSVSGEMLTLHDDAGRWISIWMPPDLVLCHAEEYPPGRQPLRIRITPEILGMFEAVLVDNDAVSRVALRAWLDHQWEHAEVHP